MLAKLICRIFKHKWKTLSIFNMPSGMVAFDGEVECLRCGHKEPIKWKWYGGYARMADNSIIRGEYAR